MTWDYLHFSIRIIKKTYSATLVFLHATNVCILCQQCQTHTHIDKHHQIRAHNQHFTQRTHIPTKYAIVCVTNMVCSTWQQQQQRRRRIKKAPWVWTPSVQRYLFGCITCRHIYIYIQKTSRSPRDRRTRPETPFHPWYGVTVGAAAALLRATHPKMNFTFVCHMYFVVPDYAFLVQNISSFIHTHTCALAHRGVRAEYFSYTGHTHVLFIICRSVSDGDGDVPVHTAFASPSPSSGMRMCKTWII